MKGNVKRMTMPIVSPCAGPLRAFHAFHGPDQTREPSSKLLRHIGNLISGLSKLLILNRGSLVSAEHIHRFRALIMDINPLTSTIPTPSSHMSLLPVQISQPSSQYRHNFDTVSVTALQQDK